MRDWFVDGFDAEAWWNIQETIRRGNFIDGNDVFGQIMCGALCFDLTLRDTEWNCNRCEEFILTAEAFLLGENTGYGYTVNGTPYDYGECVCLTFDVHQDYQTTLKSFLEQIDHAVNNDMIWAKFADTTNPVWKGLE